MLIKENNARHEATHCFLSFIPLLPTKISNTDSYSASSTIVVISERITKEVKKLKDNFYLITTKRKLILLYLLITLIDGNLYIY